MMFLYFPAALYNCYAISVHIYLQKMLKLELDFPEVHKHFMNGNHVIDHSVRLWAGIFPDLATMFYREFELTK